MVKNDPQKANSMIKNFYINIDCKFNTETNQRLYYIETNIKDEIKKIMFESIFKDVLNGEYIYKATENEDL